MPRRARRRAFPADAGDCVHVGGGADPEHDRAAFAHERQAPLRGHGRRRERLRHRDLVTVCLLAPRRGPRPRAGSGARPSTAQESVLRRSASSSVTSPVGQRRGERDPRRAAAAADVDDRAVGAADELEPRERVVEQHAPRLGRIAKRGQARRLENGGEPALEPSSDLVVTRGRRRRSGSAPCPRSSCRPRGRPSGAGARPCARPPSSARARSARPVARACSALADGERLERRLAAVAVAGRVDDHLLALVRSARDDRVPRYWIASIVWPWRPISIPRSRPEHVATIASSSPRSSTGHWTPIAPAIRSTSSRRRAGARSPSRRPTARGRRVATVAITRAGA